MRPGGVRRAADAEILFVVPFGREALVFAQKVKRHLPLDLDPAKGARGLPFPILLDADHTLTSGLDLLRTEWTGAKADQLVPAVFVFDVAGVVRFKHVAQASTWDRPTGREIVDILRGVAGTGGGAHDGTREAIVQAAKDYVEGWYEGSAERLRRALHPDLAKRKVVREGETS